MTNREFETRENHQGRSEEEKKSNQFLLGALIGGIAGAVAGMLFAPKAGKELRGTINEQASAFLERSTQMREDVVDKSAELAVVTKEKAASLSKAVAQQSTDLVQKAKGLSSSSPKAEEVEKETSTNYISLKAEPADAEGVADTTSTLGGDEAVQKKLEEAKRAFDEEETRMSLK